MFALVIMNKELVSGLYNELQMNHKKTNLPMEIKKRAKDRNNFPSYRHLPKVPPAKQGH